MVAKINTPKRLLDALNYNEKKVGKGCASCIGAAGYLREAGEMNFYQKLEVLENRSLLNERASTKTLHVSLNFDPSEKLSNETLFLIASEYMERIGFNRQPFSVYRHTDSGHPHLHIVSTTIKEDGGRINTHNLGRNQSEKARKELEKMFGLLPAQKQKKGFTLAAKPVDASKAIYGKAETKGSIAGVVNFVLNHYSFSSLPEFNAALRQFNVAADRGKEEGRIYRHRGLVYRILNEKGEKIGVPIKASSISGKPTLEALEKRFGNNEKNDTKREELKAKIDGCLSASSSLQDLIQALDKKEVFVLPRKNPEGRLYGITFVDNESKCVFNGSDLGKLYSAAAIQSKLATDQNIGKPKNDKQDNKPSTQKREKAIQFSENKTLPKETILDQLLSSKSFDFVPSELLKKKKRKKKRNL